MQRYARCWETKAGAKERAGFIDAPEIGPAKSASSAMTDPTAIPAVIPRSLAPVETLRITNINRAARMISRISDCSADPAGTVPPRVGCCGNSPRKKQTRSQRACQLAEHVRQNDFRFKPARREETEGHGGIKMRPRDITDGVDHRQNNHTKS